MAISSPHSSTQMPEHVGWQGSQRSIVLQCTQAKTVGQRDEQLRSRQPSTRTRSPGTKPLSLSSSIRPPPISGAKRIWQGEPGPGGLPGLPTTSVPQLSKQESGQVTQGL